MIDALLSRLQKVRKTSSGFIACCPAHEDKSPSMSVTEKNGKILLHCFAGCEPESILDAIGLKWGDLFADPMDASSNAMSNYAGYRLQKAAKDLDPLERDMAVLVYANAVWKQGRELGVEDAARVQLAIERLEATNERAG